MGRRRRSQEKESGEGSGGDTGYVTAVIRLDTDAPILIAIRIVPRPGKENNNEQEMGVGRARGSVQFARIRSEGVTGSVHFEDGEDNRPRL